MSALNRDAEILLRGCGGSLTRISVGELIDFVREAILDDLQAEGLVSQAAIDARIERQREVARMTLREDRVRLV